VDQVALGLAPNTPPPKLQPKIFSMKTWQIFETMKERLNFLQYLFVPRKKMQNLKSFSGVPRIFSHSISLPNEA